MQTIIFEHSEEDWKAINQAEKWCKENGYSVGSMQSSEPMGLMKGDWDIAKWRNLSASERRQLDGTITGDDKRHGPVTINIFSPALPQEDVTK